MIAARSRLLDREALEASRPSEVVAGGLVPPIPTRHGVLMALVPPPRATVPLIVAEPWPGWLQPATSRRPVRPNPSPFERSGPKGRPRYGPGRRG
jgi:hypothetical protein